MSWKFWKREAQAKPPQSFDEFQWPPTVGGSLPLLVGMFMQRLPPFANWKSPTATVPPELESLVTCSAWGFQLSLWFVMLAAEHGQPAADVTKEAFLGMLGVANPELETETRNLLAFSYQGMQAFSGDDTLNINGKEIEMPLTYFLAVHFLTRNTTSPYYNCEPNDRSDITLEFAKCLDHANQAAIKMFVPMHKAITSFSTDGFPKLDRKP